MTRVSFSVIAIACAALAAKGTAQPSTDKLSRHAPGGHFEASLGKEFFHGFLSVTDPGTNTYMGLAAYRWTSDAPVGLRALGFVMHERPSDEVEATRVGAGFGVDLNIRLGSRVTLSPGLSFALTTVRQRTTVVNPGGSTTETSSSSTGSRFILGVALRAGRVVIEQHVLASSLDQSDPGTIYPITVGWIF